MPAGDPPKLKEVREQLKQAGFEAPNVFPKDKTKGSKRVDISLTTDMLLYAARKHYDIAILVAGDEDYVPLVRAVKGEGARVHVWFLSNRELEREVKALRHVLDQIKPNEVERR